MARSTPTLGMVFIDKIWAATTMTCSLGRSHRGDWLRMGYPNTQRKTTTPVVDSRMTGVVASMVLDGTINGNWLEAYAR